MLPSIDILSPDNGTEYNDSNDINENLPGVQIEVQVETDQPLTSVEIWKASSNDCNEAPSPLDPEGKN